MGYYAKWCWVQDEEDDVDRIAVAVYDDSDHSQVEAGITSPELDIEVPGGTAYLTAEDLTADDEGDHVFVHEISGTRLPTGVPLLFTLRVDISSTTYELTHLDARTKL